MYDITVITEQLRNEIINLYKKLKAKFDTFEYVENENDYFEEENDLSDETSNEELKEAIDEVCDETYSRYRDEVEEQILNNIRNSQCKNIIYLILLEDVYEDIKSRQILNENIIDEEIYYLKILEGNPLNKIISELNCDDEFLLNFFSIFYEYNIFNSDEDKFKNRKIIELSGNIKYMEKFKIYKLDDIQYMYKKRRF